MIKSKKAVVEIQFNWIFILVAGAIILVFFVMLATRQKESSETRVNIFVVRALESILTGAKVSTDSATKVTLPVGNTQFDCDGYSVGNAHRELKQMTVFTPDFIKGKEIIAWSYPWDVPFRATNFLYLTSPQVRYIIVHDTAPAYQNFANEIKNKLPEDIKTEIKDVNTLGTQIDDKNNYKVRFVYITSGTLTFPALPSGFKTPDKDITAVKITPDASDAARGNLHFYKKSGSSWADDNSDVGVSDINYYGYATIFAAIFAEDEYTYDCVMKKEFEKLNRVAEVLKMRSESLNSNVYAPGKPAANTDCQNFHNQAATYLGVLTSPSCTFPSCIANLQTESSNLKIKNKEAESKSCALIY